MTVEEIEAFLVRAGWKRTVTNMGKTRQVVGFYQTHDVKLPGGIIESRDFRVRFNKQSTTVELLMRRCNRWMRVGGAPFASTNTRMPLGEGVALFIGGYKIPAAR